MSMRMNRAWNRLWMEANYAFSSPLGVDHPILDQAASLDELLCTRKSLIRFGDGEATIMEGGHIYFQRNSWHLQRRLREIMKFYTRGAPYLIAVPAQVMLSFASNRACERDATTWRKARFIFSSLLPKSEIPPLLDAMIFREDSHLENSAIAELWAGYQTIYFVHSNYKYYIDFRAASVGQDVRFVSVYGANAYSNSSKVLSEITRHAATVKGGASAVIALVCAGPAGKVIVAHLAARQIRALDCGHYFDYKFYDIRRGRIDE